ncbi:MAG TPA: hypothetical protein VHD85_14230, partial [Terracidiphilus sp.]|nr:hypothetical protein [Terracidiphilus sp.]
NAVDDVDCVMVEINIDYFKNLGAHVLFGVALNAITDAVIDPAVVYVLRWMAARQSKMPEFAPLYTITS